MTALLLQATWILPIIFACASFCQADLEVVYQWKYIDYVWENDTQKVEAVAVGQYDCTKITTNDIELLSDGRILVTTPKYSDNPASLSTISNQTGEGGPLLAPYPDWTWHSKKDCSGITSVHRVSLDDCNRLWLVDSGKIGNEQVCPAKILAFDPETDELIEEFEIPSHLCHSPSNESRGLLEMQIAETTNDSCNEIWVYISDLEGYALLIWDRSDIWRLDHSVFSPMTDGEIFSIESESFIQRSGPEGLMITPPGFLEEPYMIVKPLSALKTFAVTLQDLHNSKFGLNVTYYITNWTAPSQEPAKIFSTNGIVLVNFVEQMALGCWNLQDPLLDDYVTVLETNSTTLQYSSSAKMTVDPHDGSEKIWITTNRWQKYIRNTMDFTDVNFRIMTADIDSSVKGTVCEPHNYTIASSIMEKNYLYYKTEI